MSEHNVDNGYTDEEMQANSRADALGMIAAVVILVGLVIFYVAS